jgi:predicted Zn-dependent peptidase
MNRTKSWGVSHFLEHLFFKGTERRPTAQEISETIEGVGGILNAATDREVTVYWVKVARPHFTLAMDLLIDMLRHSRFDPEELEKERRVVLEELAMVNDAPERRVDSLIDELCWPQQPLGREVVGTRESVLALTRDRVLDYVARQYVPNNCVVSVAGDITHEEVVEALAAGLDDWRASMPSSWYPAIEANGLPRLGVEYRRSEQAHLCLALPGVGSLDPDRYAHGLLNVILGEGMSSRLFLEIREKQALAYDVASRLAHYLDTGSLVVYAGVSPCSGGRLGSDTKGASALGRSGLGGLTKARELSKGRLLLRMEHSGGSGLARRSEMLSTDPHA